jgi:hypothetical protein
VAKGSLSVGYPTRLVTISAITPDKQTAICVDRHGVEARVPMNIQPAKGILPQPGEQWIITQSVSNTWTFAAIATNDPAKFTNSGVAGEGELPPGILPPQPPVTPPDGSIPGSAIVPGSLTGVQVQDGGLSGADIAAASITSLNLATAAAATNIILDPQFTSSGMNVVRQGDPGTTCTWTFASPNASVGGGAGVCTLALMPSTLVPLYVNPNEQYYLSVVVTLPGGAPAGISAGIQLFLNDGSYLGPLLPVSGQTQTVAQLVTIPPGESSAYVRLIITGLPAGMTATFSAPTCYITQGPSQMQPGSVGNAAIQANSIDVNKMQAGSIGVNQLQANSVSTSALQANSVATANLQAGAVAAGNIQAHVIGTDQLITGLVYAGIVDATTVTGATLQNSMGNPKTSINPDGSFTVTNAAGIVIFKIAPDGTIYWYTASGQLQQEIQPPGSQLVYQSTTGPFICDFEPPMPNVLLAVNYTNSATSYATVVGTPVAQGSVITISASCATGITATGVTDSKGNSYALLTSQTTLAPFHQVFHAVNIASALTATDTITVTYASASTSAKAIVALATVGLLPAPLDYSAQASGTGTAPSVSGTPTAYGDMILTILANGGASGPSSYPDGGVILGSVSSTGTHTVSAYYSTNIASSGSFTASATLPSSVNWSAVTIGYLVSPAQPFVPSAPVPTAASFLPSTLWADDGNFSCRVTKVGTAAQWGITFPPFPVSASSPVAMKVILDTVDGSAIAWAQANWGFTFWSGPNGTGTNLGSASFMAAGGPYYNLTQGTHWILTYSTAAPAGAVSATSWLMEYQADTAGQYVLVDDLRIPGGLVYSNSPYATTGPYGNQVDQGINFYGQPGLTNVLGVEDPYNGTQLMSIDASGNVQAQSLTTATDLTVAGQSLLKDLLPPPAQGLVNYGWIAANPWPSSGGFGTTETALWQLDANLIGGRAYEFVMNPTTIGGTGGTYPNPVHLTLHFTTDGSTPTTSSQLANEVNAVLAAGNMGHGHPGLRCQFFPPANALYKFLVCGWCNSGTFNFSTGDPYIRCSVNDMGAVTGGETSNNILVLGTGTGGGATPQNYNEYFDCSNSWSFWEYGQRNTNGTLYQGAYSGEGYAQHAWLQWGFGSRGNGLNTVLNYQVNYVKVRLTNQHSWYNSGATVSWHSANGYAPNQGLNGVTSELQNWSIAEGATLWTTLGSGAWAPFKAGGVTYAVLHPPNGSQSLNYYSYYAGPNAAESQKPQLWVNYTH